MYMKNQKTPKSKKPAKSRCLVPVSLPPALAEEIDELVRIGKFGSRSEAIRFGVRLVCMLEGKLHLKEQDIYRELLRG